MVSKTLTEKVSQSTARLNVFMIYKLNVQDVFNITFSFRMAEDEYSTTDIEPLANLSPSDSRARSLVSLTGS